MFGLRILSGDARERRVRDAHCEMASNLASRVSHSLFLPRTFTSDGPEIGFAAPFENGACGFVMRYRSATVAGFHGLPCRLGSGQRTTVARTVEAALRQIKLKSYQRIEI
jgi:hypothetical protein